MLRELAEAVEELTAQRPLVLVLEDLHWSDAATLDWVAAMAGRRAAARLLVLGTYRPAEAVVQAHPVRRVTQELLLHSQGVEFPLRLLAEPEVAAYLTQRLGAEARPERLARGLHERTEGNPLFLVTVVDELVRQAPAGWELGEGLEAAMVGVPENLRQLIDRQLAQLPREEQQILEAAGVVGVEFTAAAVAAGVEQAVEQVEEWCTTWGRQGRFVQTYGVVEWPDGAVTASYGFRHALYREILYERVPISRRMRWHRQIGWRLEAAYGPRGREVAAELAEHFVHGRDAVRAVRYLHYAGEQAVQRSAYQEALQQLTRGLELLATLPETPARARQELDLLITLGPVLSATKGYSALEVEHTYTRARELCQQMEDTLQLSQVLWGLLTCYIVRAEHQTARQLGEQLLNLGQQEAALLFLGHFALGSALYCLGAFTPAHEHWSAALPWTIPSSTGRIHFCSAWTWASFVTPGQRTSCGSLAIRTRH
jgi:predicted ATPase